jgi:hypothetical protein
MMMMIANDCAHVHRGCFLQGSTVDRLTYAHAESKKELIQKLEREREAVLKAQTSKKVFVPSLIRAQYASFQCGGVWNSGNDRYGCKAKYRLMLDISGRRVELSAHGLHWLWNMCWCMRFVRIKTPQVYTNAKSEELAKKLEASGNTAKHRMYLGSQKSPAGSPTSSTASGLDLCLRMCLRPGMRKPLG